MVWVSLLEPEDQDVWGPQEVMVFPCPFIRVAECGISQKLREDAENRYLCLSPNLTPSNRMS